MRQQGHRAGLTLEAFEKHMADTGDSLEKLQSYSKKYAEEVCARPSLFFMHFWHSEDVPVARDLCYRSPVSKVEPSS